MGMGRERGERSAIPVVTTSRAASYARASIKQSKRHKSRRVSAADTATTEMD